jgi:hypothetical protein
MNQYIIATPYLDECGAVYLPTYGLDGACSRLSPAASEVWRALVDDEGCVDPNRIPIEAYSFIDELVSWGAIRKVAGK